MIYSIILLLLMVSPGWALPASWYEGKLSTGTLNPDRLEEPKPRPPKIEWYCIEREMLDKFTLEISTSPRPCVREIGFGSDSKVYWRDPRKGEPK